ncbi:MAG: DUF433 domain-containing protein [Verrucomicrobia bacterium]|nr:DUF433 domain-containing protein [Verrucomicrobiota bacterium]
MISRIELNPEVCSGHPLVRGTRITVDTVLGYLSAGDSVDEVLQAHPRLERADVLACIDYARLLSSAHTTVQLAS